MANEPLDIFYKNHRGEISRRKLIPIKSWYGRSPFHSEHGDQWFLRAHDITDPDNHKIRDFLLLDFNPPASQQCGYRHAFNEMACMMGFGSNPENPQKLFEEHMRPQLAWLIEQANGHSGAP